VLQTDGSNLKAILSHDKVDPKKTISNDMTEVLSVLGIEAARQSFLN
jgi:DNA-directed RNA polymerase II subunit RPB1